MTSQYEILLQVLKARKCIECHGSGQCDDAELGDIYFRTWICTACGGSGLNDVKWNIEKGIAISVRDGVKMVASLK